MFFSHNMEDEIQIVVISTLSGEVLKLVCLLHDGGLISSP